MVTRVSAEVDISFDASEVPTPLRPSFGVKMT
jgi:hypothetical protein